MKRVHIKPKAYHSLGFNPKALPNLAEAGFVSASILKKSQDALSFLLSGSVDVKETDAMAWGSCVDARWLTPELFGEDYLVAPRDAPKKPSITQLNAAKPSQKTLDDIAWWEAFNRSKGDRSLIDEETLVEVDAAVRMLEQHPLAAELHAASDKQVAIIGDSPIIPGTKAKCLFDMLPMHGPFEDAIVDLKTTNATSDHAFAQTLYAYQYDLSMSYYALMAEAAGFGARKRGILIWQKSSWPYDVHVREISQADMAVGRATAINRVHALLKMNPADIQQHFDTDLKVVEMADWMRNERMKS